MSKNLLGTCRTRMWHVTVKAWINQYTFKKGFPEPGAMVAYRYEARRVYIFTK